MAPGNNFGIGFTGTSSNNLVEDNTIVGNSNGIYLQPTAVTNIFRRNLVMGNPPIQVAVNDPASNGFDIWNLSPAGANTFQANVCLTSVNAPCPASAPSLTASPNPIPVTGNAIVGTTTLSWNAPDAGLVEIRIGSPDGSLFTLQGNRGSIQTGNWVREGMTFYLQDVTQGRPLTSDYTLAELVVHLQQR